VTGEVCVCVCVLVVTLWGPCGCLQACDKTCLKLIRSQDEWALAFLFYMKGLRSNERRFESALCRGWFIQMLEHTDTVRVAEAEDEGPSFYFIIGK